MGCRSRWKPSPSWSTTLCERASGRSWTCSSPSSSCAACRKTKSIYRFGHQIIRDTAYGSLLKRSRAALHERFVEWAERVNRERGRELEFEEILGYHLEQAYHYRTSLGIVDADARDVGGRAATKLSAAGRRALERGDLPAAVSLLRRSVGLLPRDLPVRIELMVELADGLGQLGDFVDAANVLEEAGAVATELGDDRLGTRVRLLQAMIDVFGPSGAGSAADALEVAARAVSVLEPTGDDAGLARAWRLTMLLQGMLGRYDEVSTAANRVIEHADRAGDRRLASRSAPVISFTLVHGTSPVSDAIPAIKELMRAAAGDRKTEAVLLGAMAQLHAMQGRFEEARELYRRGQGILAELGGGVDAGATSIDTARVEVLAGDLRTAEAELRRDNSTLEGLGETYFRSYIVGILAHVLLESGHRDEAASFAELGETLSDADDVLSQVVWRTARARLLADDGDTGAEALARSAIELAEGTADLELQADALDDLGAVLAALGNHDEAEAAIRQALQLYERKGDVVSAARVRQRLRLATA